jgi:hypothetical protein
MGTKNTHTNTFVHTHTHTHILTHTHTQHTPLLFVATPNLRRLYACLHEVPLQQGRGSVCGWWLAGRVRVVVGDMDSMRWYMYVCMYIYKYICVLYIHIKGRQGRKGAAWQLLPLLSRVDTALWNQRLHITSTMSTDTQRDTQRHSIVSTSREPWYSLDRALVKP